MNGSIIFIVKLITLLYMQELWLLVASKEFVENHRISNKLAQNTKSNSLQGQCENLDLKIASREIYSANGGWGPSSSYKFLVEGPCNIDVASRKDLSQAEFNNKYAYSRPVIIKGASFNEHLKELTTQGNLLKNYGHTQVKLSSANSYSYDRQQVTFDEYCKHFLLPQSLSTLGNETFYFFGDNDNAAWFDLLSQYKLPPYEIAGHTPQLSFGVAGSGSGVPFHFHGPGFSETLWGRKRWFMYPPDLTPPFHPNRTTLQWLHEDYVKLKNDPHLLECTLNPGELIYFPDHWWHATLNIDASVFMSTFLSP